MIFFVGIAVLALLLALYVLLGRSAQVHDFRDLEGRTRPIDLPAFQNLNDPEEEKFLRRRLPPAEFRSVQRARLLASMEYVLRAAANAAVLIRLGQVARKSPEPQVSLLGRKLVEDAVHLRIYAFLAIGKLGVRFLFPTADLSLRGFAANYERALYSVSGLIRVQSPLHANVVSHNL